MTKDDKRQRVEELLELGGHGRRVRPPSASIAAGVKEFERALDQAMHELTRDIYLELLEDEQVEAHVAFYRSDLGRSILDCHARFAEEFERRLPAVLANLQSKLNTQAERATDQSPAGSRIILTRDKNRGDVSAKRQVTRISAYGLVTDNDHLLLCRLSDHLPAAGMWTLPGGGIEFGEHPETAMVREVEEETGLLVAPVSLAGIASIADEVPDRAFHGIRIIYHAKLLGGTLRSERDGTTDLCQWHPIATLSQLPVVDLVEAALPMIAGGDTQHGVEAARPGGA